MQTILGAGGTIGKLLAKDLVPYTSSIRLVSRHPKKINETDELFPADLIDSVAVEKAVAGSEVVYLAAGLQYKTKVWQNHWPLIMDNVINACKKHSAKLVFFDNVYMYDPAYLDDLTEETPERPVSKKGKVRKEIADHLLNEIKKGSLKGMIVRSADFYGPGVTTSIMMETVYKRMKMNKKPMWMGNANCFNSMTFTPDAAKATALLGNNGEAYGQVWHLPTSDEKLTGKEWIRLFAEAMNRKSNFSSFSGKLIKTIGWFNPFFKELGEMSYQFENDYYFNSDKFKNRYPDFKVTNGKEGVNEIVKEG